MGMFLALGQITKKIYHFFELGNFSEQAPLQPNLGQKYLCSKNHLSLYLIPVPIMTEVLYLKKMQFGKNALQCNLGLCLIIDPSIT